MYKLFRNLNMFWKFTIFGLIAAVLPTLAAIQSYNSMQTSKQNLDMFVEQNMALGFVVNEMYAHGLQTGQAVRNIILNPVDDKAVANLNAANKDFTDAQQKALELTKIIGKYEDLLSKVPAIWQKDANLKEQVVVLAQSGEQASAIELLVKQETPVWREVRSTLLEAKKVIQEDIIVLKEEIDHKNATNLKITVAILFIAIIMINVIMLIFWRLLQSSLDQMLERLKDIASGDGDLTRRLEVNGSDELAQSAYWLNQFMEKLSNTLCSVSSTINNLNNATTSLNNTSDQMAANAAEVSSQAVSVATASEEMAATSNDIAHNCHAAAESANNAAQTTERGFAVVQQTITGIRSRGEMTKRNAESVSSLGERSEQIGAIASTIEDIADQTNLLALNAAIEAARAGEMGRGFAVVADEVRALAERTTRATHEISVMIRNIQSETQQAIVSMEEGVKDTEKGVADAAQLESALHDILERVNDVTMQVSQIATAAEEQTATTSEITNNIHRISDVVEDTSKGASETAAASDSLYQISEELRRLMSQFKLSA